MGRLWGVLPSTTVMSVLGLALSASSAMAQSQTGPRLIEPESIAFVGLSPEPVKIRVVNGQTPGAIRALLTGDISSSAGLALSKPLDSPCTKEDDVTMETVAAGDLATLWVDPCYEGGATSGEVIIWGPAGDLIEVPVTRGAAAPGDSPASLGPAKKISMRSQTTPAFDRVECLPAATLAQNVPLSGEDGFLMMSVKPDADATCSAGQPFEFSIRDLDQAGTFTGSLDLNGTTEGGDTETTLKVRKSIFWFLLAVGIGVGVATLLALVSGPVRQRLQLDAARWSLRRRVVTAQENCLEDLKEIFGTRPRVWEVVSSDEQRFPSLAFDRELARLHPPPSLLPKVTPPELLPGGDVFSEVEKSAQEFEGLLLRASFAAGRYEQLLKSKPDGVASSPTLVVVRRRLVDGEPAVRKEDLVERLDAVHPWLTDFEDLLSQLNELLAPKDNQRAAGLIKILYETDLTDEGAVKNIKTEIYRSGAVRPPAAAVVSSQAARGLVTARQGREKKTETWKREAWVVFVTAFLSLVVAFAVAWATLYANNAAWGSEGDFAAALTWALGVSGALQVARHLNLDAKVGVG